MSNEMRNMINRFKDLMTEESVLRLRRRLPAEHFNHVSKQSINESSLSRVSSYVQNYDCAVITAFRNQLINCVSEEESEEVLNLSDNRARNKKLKSALMLLGYGVTKVKGSYIENYMEENAIEKKEESYFVVNMNNDSDFFDNIVALGKLYCQDSVMFFLNGGNDIFLYGTNYSDFPGYEQKNQYGKFEFGLESEFMTKVGGRPFTVMETFKNAQINSKKMITEFGRPILDKIKNLK